MNPRLSKGLKILVTLTAITLVSQRTDLDEVWAALTGFPVSGIPILVVLLAASLILSTLKWKVVLERLGQSVAYPKLIGLFWTGLFFNTFLPGRTGGDVVRALSLPRSGDSRSPAITSVVIDRGLNLLALIIISAAATCFDASLPATLVAAIRWIALATAAALAVGFAARRSLLERLPEPISRILSPLLGTSWDARAVAVTMLIALAVQASMVLINVSVARALEIPVSSTALFVGIPVTALITALPISINGFGLREAAYATLLSGFGVSAEHAVALSLAATSAIVGWSLLGGIVFVFSSNRESTPASGDLSTLGAAR